LVLKVSLGLERDEVIAIRELLLFDRLPKKLELFDSAFKLLFKLSSSLLSVRIVLFLIDPTPLLDELIRWFIDFSSKLELFSDTSFKQL
jgi:hypothetical protein